MKPKPSCPVLSGTVHYGPRPSRSRVLALALLADPETVIGRVTPQKRPDRARLKTWLERLKK